MNYFFELMTVKLGYSKFGDSYQLATMINKPSA